MVTFPKTEWSWHVLFQENIWPCHKNVDGSKYFVSFKKKHYLIATPSVFVNVEFLWLYQDREIISDPYGKIEIFGSMRIESICFSFYCVINFESNLNFLMKLFSYMTKKVRTKI